MKKNNRAEKTSKKYLAEAALLLNTLLWGGTFVIVKNSLQDVSSMLFVGLRFFIASVIIFPFIFRKLLVIKKQALYGSLLLGTILFFGFATQTIGLKYTTATKSGFITGSLVMFTPLFQLLVEKKKPAFGSVLGSFIVLAGLVFLSMKDVTLGQFIYELGGNFNTGDFFTLLCALFFSLQIVYLDKVSKEVDYLILVFFQLAVTSVLAIITSVLFSFTGIEIAFISLSGQLVTGLLYTSLLATVISYMLQTRFQKEVTPAKAGIIFSFEPIFSALFAFILLSERPTFLGIIGGILIFAGLITSELLENLRQKKKKLKLDSQSYGLPEEEVSVQE